MPRIVEIIILLAIGFAVSKVYKYIKEKKGK